MTVHTRQLLLLAPLAALAACDVVEPKAESGFEADADGWTIAGDAQADAVAPDYAGTGGNPDGLISAVDDAVGGVWYFVAPAKYLGDNAAIAGLTLRFDLQVEETPPSPFDDVDVKLTGGGITLVFDTPENPVGGEWTTYDVPLTAAGFTVDELGGTAATDDDVAAVLGATEELWIRGEFNDGPDTGKLDNVRWGEL